MRAYTEIFRGVGQIEGAKPYRTFIEDIWCCLPTAHATLDSCSSSTACGPCYHCVQAPTSWGGHMTEMELIRASINDYSGAGHMVQGGSVRASLDSYKNIRKKKVPLFSQVERISVWMWAAIFPTIWKEHACSVKPG